MEGNGHITIYVIYQNFLESRQTTEDSDCVDRNSNPIQIWTFITMPLCSTERLVLYNQQKLTLVLRSSPHLLKSVWPLLPYTRPANKNFFQKTANGLIYQCRTNNKHHQLLLLRHFQFLETRHYLISPFPMRQKSFSSNQHVATCNQAKSTSLSTTTPPLLLDNVHTYIPLNNHN